METILKMDNTNFLDQFGGNNTASSIYQGLITCNGDDMDLFTELRKDASPKLAGDTVGQEEWETGPISPPQCLPPQRVYFMGNAANSQQSLVGREKFAESFFDMETKFMGNGNKKDLKNEEMSDHLQGDLPSFISITGSTEKNAGDEFRLNKLVEGKIHNLGLSTNAEDGKYPKLDLEAFGRRCQIVVAIPFRVPTPADLTDSAEFDIYDLIINDENHLTRREISKTDEATTTDKKSTGGGGESKPAGSETAVKPKLVIKCNRCETVVGGRRDFVGHYEVCRGDSREQVEFACPLCDKSFANYLSFRTHWYRHMPHKHKCPYCDKGFRLRAVLSSHVMAIHSDVRPHVCKTCNKGYASQSSLSCHEKSHAQHDTHSCPICHKVFVTDTGLRRHVRLHKAGRNFMCEMCGERFVYKSHLVYHTSSIHAKNRPFVCDKCGKKGRFGGPKEIGKPPIAGRRPDSVVVSVCDYRAEGPGFDSLRGQFWFAAMPNLRRHWKMHDEERPFKCADCLKTFKTKHCLSHHRMRHSSDRPFVCTQCDKGFVKMSKLQEHYNTHTGNRPFVCSSCQRSFTNQANLIKHTRRIHKKKEVAAAPETSEGQKGEGSGGAADDNCHEGMFSPHEQQVDLLASDPDIVDDIDHNLSFLDEFNFSQEFALMD
ncbi:hypothetical protein AAG570_002195 [Ranatra chinensis]|uniref:C2H2-type domain-containing protein n=1 Tax=Ranatra chinensis TaxID=642074 RepID=A0ABD0Y782_9HEMI